MTETEQASHIERADIGEANISTLNVGDLQWGKIEELAAITKELESLELQNNKLIDALNDGEGDQAPELQQVAQNSATIQELGSKVENLGAIQSLAATEEAPETTKQAPEKTEKAKSSAKVSSSQLQEVHIEAPQITIMAPDMPKKGNDGSNNGKLSAKTDDVRQSPAKRDKPSALAEKPVKSRKHRTIEIGETPASQAEIQAGAPAIQAPSQPQKAEPATVEPDKAPGFYLGGDGRVRRPDGTFANKVEVRRFNKEQNVDVAKGGNGKADPSQLGLIAKTLGMLTSIGGKTPTGAGEQAGEVAGMAAGGSVFLAAKEVAGLARDVKDAAEERGISRMGDIAPYLKKQLGFTPKDGKDGEEAKDGKRRPPKQLAPGEPPKRPVGQDAKKERKQPAEAADTAAQAGTGRSDTATAPGHPAELPKTATASQQGKQVEQQPADLASQQEKPESQAPRAPAGQPGKQAPVAVAHKQGKQPQIDLASKQAKPGEQPKSAVASQQDKQAAQLKAASESQLAQSEAQHDEVIKKLEDVIDAIKPKGPSLLDSAFDAAGDMYRRRGKRGRGKGRPPRTRLSGTEAGPRQKAGSRVRGGPARPGRVDVDLSRHQPRTPQTPKTATVRAGMGKAMPALPAVSSAAGRTAGAAVKGGAAMGGAAVGRLAGAGARALPIVGQALAVGLAAYDGYQGYNDTEAQAKAFDLKGNTEASTGQKSAMAAAKVLDLGGLTSGAAGLVGSAAGAMGFQKIQDAMTFDSDDMARAIYEGMSLFTRRNPEDKPSRGDLTINNMGMGGGVTPRGVTGTTGNWGGAPFKFEGTEAENNLPSGYLAATAAVESGGNWSAINKQSGALGGWQFIPSTAAGLGLTPQDALDPEASTKAMITHTKQNQAYFEKTMGRTPEGRELYLMHQQGMGGGTKLMKNPNAQAADIVGVKAVLQNGGRADMTSQEFTQMILAKYDKAEAYNKANPGKAIDMDKIVGTKPKYEAPPMLRGGPRPGEQAPTLIPPQANQQAPSDKQPQGQATAPGDAPALTVPPAPPAALAAQPTALATPPAALAVPPESLRPVSDIQSITIRNDHRDKDKKPYAPGADTNAAMLTVLKSMDKSLKDMGKNKTKSSPTGGPVRAGGKPPVSGHPTMSGSASDFANDRR